MKRKMTEQFIAWKESGAQKPLLVYGARQVGKSYAVIDFGKRSYDRVLEVNFERNETARKTKNLPTRQLKKMPTGALITRLFYGLKTRESRCGVLNPLRAMFLLKPAEVDFLLSTDQGTIPLEVKSGENVQAKSLRFFINRFKPRYGIRASTKNFGFENTIKSVPLYALFCLEGVF